MELNAVMTHKVDTVRPENTIQEAAQIMKRDNIGMLPVFDGKRVIGVITDRDITVRATAEGKDPSLTPVLGVMTGEVICCPGSFDVLEAAELMKKRKIRRIVVVDMNHCPIGIVSLADLAARDRTEEVAEDVLEELSRSDSKRSPSR